MQAPPAGWRPDSVLVPSSPHSLPFQDHEVIDRAEAQATALTRAIAIGAGVILLVLVLALCSRALF
jgi:hypothetical protein